MPPRSFTVLELLPCDIDGAGFLEYERHVRRVLIAAFGCPIRQNPCTIFVCDNRGTTTMTNEHHPHHHEAAGVDDSGPGKSAADVGQSGGTATAGTSTNAPADQVGSQPEPAEGVPTSENVAREAPEPVDVDDPADSDDDSEDDDE